VLDRYVLSALFSPISLTVSDSQGNGTGDAANMTTAKRLLQYGQIAVTVFELTNEYYRKHEERAKANRPQSED
jgi:hypothetical protein